MKYRNLLVYLGLSAILLLGLVLRFYKLGEIPPGVNRDEASIGYTAYSLLETGKDEYGRSFPLSFQSFGDWKLPLYIYASVPFVKVLGPTELAVRLPSAIAGMLTVIITYFLVKELFKSFLNSLTTNNLQLITTFLLAISPWHVHLSRVESESNLAVFFTTLGFLLFLKGLKRPGLLPLSAVFFALPYYTYHGNHATSTLLVAGLMGIYGKAIPPNKYSFLSLLILIGLATFILSQTLQSADKTKLTGISIFGDPAIIHEKIEIPRNRLGNPNSWLARLRYNRATYAMETVSGNYLKSFSPEFLFISGGTNRAHNIENFGNLYLIEAPFFYLGILLLLYFVFKKNLPPTTYHLQLLLWWLIISPVAASITKDAPHTNRMFAIYPLPPILTALGIMWIIGQFKNRKSIQCFFVTGVALLFALNITVYLHRYFIRFPREEAQHWGWGYKKLSQLLDQPEFAEKRVVMSHPEYSPYIYLLLYSKYDPLIYQQTAARYPPTPDAFVHVKSFDRFEFREIDWTKDLLVPNTLLIDYTEFVPEFVKNRNVNKQEILLPNGKSFLTLLAT